MGGGWGRMLAGWDLVGPIPTDGGKNGVKYSLLVAATEGSLAGVSGANTHDAHLWAETLAAVIGPRPAPTVEVPQPLCLDTGSDHLAVRQAAVECTDTLPILIRWAAAPLPQRRRLIGHILAGFCPSRRGMSPCPWRRGLVWRVGAGRLAVLSSVSRSRGRLRRRVIRGGQG